MKPEASSLWLLFLFFIYLSLLYNGEWLIYSTSLIIDNFRLDAVFSALALYMIMIDKLRVFR